MAIRRDVVFGSRGRSPSAAWDLVDPLVCWVGNLSAVVVLGYCWAFLARLAINSFGEGLK